MSGSRWFGAIVAWAMVCLAAAVHAQTRPADQEPAEQYLRLQQRLVESFRVRRYDQAESIARKIIELAPNRAEGPYNLACALARQGKTDEALAALADAVRLGYGDPEHMEGDADLASVRGNRRFEELLKQAGENQAKAPFEQGKPMAGFRTIEDMPPGGLRYRLRLSEQATKDKPHRLVVWLHPGGGSGNDAAERLAPALARQGYALLVLTRKSFAGWSEADARKLLDKTLPHVAQVEGLDARRPVLLGYSAGGQMALELWREDAGRFGGVILDAAYPIDMEQYARGKLAVMPLPQSPAVRTTPIFVLVGAEDDGSKLWQSAARSWREAQVPLTLHIVPNGRHQWLFGREQVALLETWLGEVAKGQLPAGASDPKPTSRGGSGAPGERAGQQ